MRLCVVYHYFEGSAVYADNFRHFLQFGTIGHDVICLLASDVSFELPTLRNVRYITVENRNFDYGGYSYVINAGLLDDYSHVLFVNNSVRGPFWPAWFQGRWTDAFFSPFLRESKLGIFGASINILPAESRYSLAYRERHGGSGGCAHVQSFAFALTRGSLAFLKRSGFFSKVGVFSKDDMIVDYELHLSQTLLRNGFIIGCIMPEYNGIDYAQSLTASDANPASFGGDPFFAHAYLGRTPHPYETIFTKTNRNLHPPGFLEALAFSMHTAQPGNANLLFANAGSRDAFLRNERNGRIRHLWQLFKKQAGKRLIQKIRNAFRRRTR